MGTLLTRAAGVHGDGPGTEGSISASSGRALRLGMPGTCRPERTLVSVHRAGRRDPPTHLARVSSSTLQPETEENLLLSLRALQACPRDTQACLSRRAAPQSLHPLWAQPSLLTMP